jgi:hypothetical protein
MPPPESVTALEARNLRLRLGKPLAEVDRLWRLESVDGLYPDGPVPFARVGEPVDYVELAARERVAGLRSLTEPEPDMGMLITRLHDQLTRNRRDERHRNYKETTYWCDQWRQLAAEAVFALQKIAALQQKVAMYKAAADALDRAKPRRPY